MTGDLLSRLLYGARTSLVVARETGAERPVPVRVYAGVAAVRGADRGSLGA